MNNLDFKNESALFQYLVYLGDNALVLSQRLSEWCGHGPILEQDIAITNISLDILGQARLWYQAACECSSLSLDEDHIAYFRDDRAFTNIILVELPNGDWGVTIVRQYLYSSYMVLLLEHLAKSKTQKICDIAANALIETRYHLSWSLDWLKRLSQGTSESNIKMQNALNQLWHFRIEWTKLSQTEQFLIEKGMIDDLHQVNLQFLANVESGIINCGLIIPKDQPMLLNGKNGLHTEHLSYLLMELQSIQRAYPGLAW